MKKFVIRDDDLNYFSVPADIERWYGDVFTQNIPIGFAVIPFVKPVSDVYPRDIEPEDKEYPISQNRELVEYVKGNPLIEILQHGCTHETLEGVFEYRRSQGLLKETRRGKEELEQIFGREIKVFVPPHDAISNHGVLAVESENMDIIRGTGAKNFLLRGEYVANIFTMILHRIKHPQKKRMPAYPDVLNYGQHKEAYSNRLRDENLAELLGRLEYSFKKGGNFIITTHLHHFTEKKEENLKRIIMAAKELGAEFVRPSDIFLS